MKASDFLSALLYFFNDIIGTTVPGFVFLGGVFLLHPSSHSAVLAVLPKDTAWTAVLIIAVSYAVGHLLTAIHSWTYDRLVGVSNERQSPAAELFVALLRTKTRAALPTHTDKEAETLFSELKPNDFRNIAMTVSLAAGDLARRFRFLALFCHGASTALLLLAVYVAFVSLLLPSVQTILGNDLKVQWLFVTIALITAYLLGQRGNRFSTTSLRAPYAVAIGDLLYPKDASKEAKK